MQVHSASSAWQVWHLGRRGGPRVAGADTSMGAGNSTGAGRAVRGAGTVRVAQVPATHSGRRAQALHRVQPQLRHWR